MKQNTKFAISIFKQVLSASRHSSRSPRVLRSKVSRGGQIGVLVLALFASSQLFAMAQDQPGGALWQEDADWRAAHAQPPQRQLTMAERETQQQEALRRKGVEMGKRRREGLGGESQWGGKAAHQLGGLGTIVENRLESAIRIKSALGLVSAVKARDKVKLQSGIAEQLKIEIMSGVEGGTGVGELLFDLKEITRHLSSVNTVIVQPNQTLTIQGVLKEGGKSRDREFVEWVFNNMKSESEQRWRQDDHKWLRGLYTVLISDITKGRELFTIERGAFVDLYCNYGLPPRERGAGAPYKDPGVPYCSMDRSTRAGLERSVIISNIRPLKRGPMPPASPRPGMLVPEMRVPAGYNQL